MAVPGYSIPELFQLLSKVKDIWDAFYGEFDNAPNRIGELIDSFEFLRSALVTCHNLCQVQSIELPNSLVRPLVLKLHECQTFTRKYHSLTGEAEFHASQTRRMLQRGVDTIRYTFDGDAAKLKTDLTSEAIKLNTFTNMLQMGLLVSVIHPNNSTLTPTVPSSASFIVPTPQSNLTASDADKFLERYPELRSSITIAPIQGSHRSGWASRIGWLRRPRPNNQTAALPYSPAPLPSNATLVPIVPENSFYCSANIAIDLRSIPLQSYSIRQSDSGPVVEWRGVDNAISISHYLGPETIPITTHSVQRKPHHQVHFHFAHRVLLWNGGRLCLDKRVYVRYEFVADEPMRRRSEFETFQGRVCGRELIGGRFECDLIRSRRSIEAKNQHLKIWKLNREPLSYVLSFYVGENRGNTIHPHQEYPVRWLEKKCYEMDPKKRKYTIQLRFVNLLGVPDNTDTPRGTISWSRQSFSFSRTSSTGSSMAPTSAPTSPPDYGFGILETLNGPLQGADYAERYASQDIIHDVEFLLIKFTSATDMDNFKVVFHEVHTCMESVNNSDVLALSNPALENGSDSNMATATRIASIDE